MKRCTRIN